MIDIKNEQVLSLAEAAKLKVLPRRRNGKRPHVATLFRWASVGLRGVTLETIQCGGTRCTSVQAIQRFFDRCTDPSTPASSHISSKTRQREIERSERELTEAGI